MLADQMQGLERIGMLDDESSKAELAAEITTRLLQEAKDSVARESFERLQAMGEGLSRKFLDQVTKRAPVEERWIDDMRQYHGRYDPKIEANITEIGGSKAFVNITRPKTQTFASRLADMLIPTDEQNWDITTTAIPEVSDLLKSQKPLQLEGQPVTTPQGAQVQEGDLAKGIEESVKKACDDMRQEMLDQLQECNYNAVQRDVIEDICVFGNGILKGPHVVGRYRKAWIRDKQSGGHVLSIIQQLKPTAIRVSPWDFFPDMSATRLEDCEFIFERHYMTRRQVRKLLDTPGFNKEAIRQLLSEERSKVTTPTHIAKIRDISGDLAASMWDQDRFEVVEYHGPIDKSDLEAAGVKLTQEQFDDPTYVPEGIVWFCDNLVLKAVLNPLDTEDRPYSVGYLYKDDSSLFGFGLPYMLRSAQRIINAVARMINDNGGLAASGNLVIDKTKVQPANGEWKVTAKKVWEVVGEIQNIDQVFKMVEFPGHLNELMAIFNLFYKLADDEINLPLIVQGSQATYMTKTAEGMAMLMNSANVVLRRAVKSYDDDITVPFLTKLYDWNMQFNENDKIKGDYNIVAKGSSVLMERQQQVQTLMNAIPLMENPSTGVWINDKKIATALLKNMRLADVMNDEAEMQQKADKIANQRRPDPKEMEVKVKMHLAALQEAELKLKADIHNNEMKWKMQEAVISGKLREEELKTRVTIKTLDVDADIAKFNAELAARYQTGEGI